MNRRYTIKIEPNVGAAERLKSVEKILGCSVSEPSNWLEYGSTKERGLTFLDKNGRELASPVFVHRASFTRQETKGRTEVHEIKALIFEALAKHYSIRPQEVRINVAAYNRQ